MQKPHTNQDSNNSLTTHKKGHPHRGGCSSTEPALQNFIGWFKI